MTAEAARPRRAGLSAVARRRRATDFVARHAALLAFGLVFALPLYWMIITAVKPREELFTVPLTWWPSEFQWGNYPDALGKAPFATYFSNTAIITVFVVLGRVFASALVGYGFAVGRFRGRDALFVLLLATMMIPPQVTLIPMFIIFRSLGWVGTNLPLIVPPWFGFEGAFYIFLMRQFFLGIPRELEEAARVDGAGAIRVWWQIYVPLAIPALTVVGVLSFIGAWNDFFGPLIFLPRQEDWTLVLGLAGLNDPNYADYRLQMAAGLLISLPVLAIFFATRKLITEGIATTGLKG